VIKIQQKRWGYKDPKKTQLYNTNHTVKAGKSGHDQRASNQKKTEQTVHVVAAVKAAFDQDRRITVHKISLATGLTTGIIYRILSKDLGLAKKDCPLDYQTAQQR